MHGWKISQMKEMENWPLLSVCLPLPHHQFVIVFLSILRISSISNNRRKRERESESERSGDDHQAAREENYRDAISSHCRRRAREELNKKRKMRL